MWAIGGRDYNLTPNCDKRLITDYKRHLTLVNNEDFRVRVHVEIRACPGR